MTFSFKLSRRLAQNYWMVGVAATLAGCVGENPTDSNNSNPVHTITLAPPTAAVAVNGTVQFYATLRDAEGSALGGRPVTWTSADEAVATVSATGVVRGTAMGSTTIRAESEGKSTVAGLTVTAGGGAPGAGYYVAPNGSSGGDGSEARPWDLATGLAGAGGRVQPGDTVWLRGGTYRGAFRATACGVEGRPVVFRQYPGERAIIDGTGTPSRGPSVFYVGCSWTVFWGFEIMNSDPVRTTTLTGNGIRPNSVANYASHTKYVNLVVHDGGVAFYNDPEFMDVEIVGCVVYNNGWQGPDRGHGHALYLKSYTGPVIVRDNILFSQFGYGVHVYTNAGAGELNNIHLEGNVSFNNGTIATNSTSANILLGGDGRATGDVLKRNMTYYPAGVPSANVKIGYGTLVNGSVELVENYFMRGGPVLTMGYWTSVTATGNSFVGTGSLITLNDPTLSAGIFAGQSSSSLPTATRVFVRKNPYEEGRANIVVYNWSNAGAVSVDLSGIVPVGAQYEIRNVHDLYGAPVASGTFGGGSVNLPIESIQSPAPVGWSKRAPSTGTEFNTYIVTIRR